MERDAVRDYYDGVGAREWARLARPKDGALEFAINRRVIAAHLAPASRVLDLGGGPGRYALWLAEEGHRVTLADLSPGLLALARAQVAASPVAGRIEAIVEADARDLSRWTDGHFDAALVLGPFYHLPDPAERAGAARELARVVRQGGIVFVALMPRLALLRRTIADPAERAHLSAPGFLARLLDEGIFDNDQPGRFTGGYGVRPEEVGPFFARAGFAQLALLSSESAAPDLQGELATMATIAPEHYAAALETLLSVAGEPGILGLANHLLYVGRRE